MRRTDNSGVSEDYGTTEWNSMKQRNTKHELSTGNVAHMTHTGLMVNLAAYALK